MNENYVIDVIANLANRVHSLEQQLRDTQSNVEKLAEELATVKHLADSNEQGIAMLDERTQQPVEFLVKLAVEMARYRTGGDSR
jgi:peptidoglycan hydrolase CwlO-like protein